MTLNKVIKKVSAVWSKAGFTFEITEDNLSECLKALLETFPTMFKNELPEIYNNLVVIVDIDSIKDR